MHPQAINKHLISAHAIVSCTMLVEEQLGHVLAPPEDPGRFYGRGKTGPNTDFFSVGIFPVSNTAYHGLIV